MRRRASTDKGSSPHLGSPPQASPRKRVAANIVTSISRTRRVVLDHCLRRKWPRPLVLEAIEAIAFRTIGDGPGTGPRAQPGQDQRAGRLTSQPAPAVASGGTVTFSGR